MEETTPRGPDRVLLEIIALLAVLIAGAVLRYWLSTVLPFDAGELAVLLDGHMPGRHLRVPFIMFNGVGLFAGYLFVRRSTGPEGAMATLLLLQASLTFQEQALRIRPVVFVLLPAVVALTVWRLYRPATRLPPVGARICLVVAGVFAVRLLFLGVTLPARMADVRAETTADPADLLASLERCGGDGIVASAVDACDIAWPEQIGVAQQEAWLNHRSFLGPRSVTLPGAAPPDHVVLFDAAAASLFAVPPDDVDRARRRLAADAL